MMKHAVQQFSSSQTQGRGSILTTWAPGMAVGREHQELKLTSLN